MKKNIFLIFVGIILSIATQTFAEMIIPSKSVSYQNNKTTETTVEGSLNELFSAVDINKRLWDTTSISNIGTDGTVSDAISTLNSNIGSINSSISELSSQVASKTTIKYTYVTIAFTNGVSYDPSILHDKYVINLVPSASDWSCNFSYVNGFGGIRIILYDQNGNPLNFTGNQAFVVWYA